MPIPQLNIGFQYRQHLATLIEMQKEIGAQARYRPNGKVPPGTLRIVRRHLADLRRLRVRGGGKSRVFPAIPGDAMRFSTLSLLLAMTRHEFESFGTAFQYDREPEPPQPVLAASDDVDDMAIRMLEMLYNTSDKLDAAIAKSSTRPGNSASV